MKPISLKKIPFHLSLCAVLVLALFIIHSCKKDSKFIQLSAADSVNQAKTWYESTYPVNNALSVNNNLTTLSVNHTGNTQFDYSQYIKPDWNHTAKYKRFGKDVIEMPVDPGKVLNYGLKNANTGQLTSAKENSRAWFLLLNDGKQYSAYIMVLIGDPGYINGDPSKMAKNSYRKRDANFSGMLEYFTPKGKFIRSYKYINGARVTGNSQAAGATNKQTQSVKKVNELAIICIDWFDTIWDNNGNTVWEQYLYTTCGEYDIGGGGDSGGSGSPPPTCEVTNSVSRQTVNVAQPDPGDGGDGSDPGYPDPTPVSCTAPDINNNIINMCMKAQVNAVLAQGLDSYTSDVANFVFGDNPYFDMNFDQVSTLPPEEDGETNCQGNPATQSTFTADISLNGNTLPTASKEFIAATIMHEVLHAYMTFTGKLNDFDGNQHTQMANNYIYSMQHDLQVMFPNLSNEDAQALAWGGLSETQPWRDMVSNYPDQANNILLINQQFKNATGTKGQRCQ